MTTRNGGRGKSADPAEPHSFRDAGGDDDSATAHEQSPRIDPAKLAALYVEHGAALRRVITGIVRNADLAGDILQLVFVKALEKSHQADPQHLKGWLFRVATHEAISNRRREQTATSARKRLASQGEEQDEAPDEPLFRKETVERVQKALETLPPEQADVIRRRLYREQTFAEIATEQHLPLGTVLTRMRLALAKLRNLLED